VTIFLRNRLATDIPSSWHGEWHRTGVAGKAISQPLP
jgi:hypothetical protein